MALGGRTVSEWQSIMSEAEFVRWCTFYEKSPFDDVHRYHRPAALISGSMSGGEMGELIKFLINDRSIPDEDVNSEAKSLAAFGIFKE